MCPWHGYDTCSWTADGFGGSHGGEPQMVGFYVFPAFRIFDNHGAQKIEVDVHHLGMRSGRMDITTGKIFGRCIDSHNTSCGKGVSLKAKR